MSSAHRIEEGFVHVLCALDLGFEIRLAQLPLIFSSRYRDPVRYNFLTRGPKDIQPVRIQFDPVEVRFGSNTKRSFQVFGTFFELGALSLEFITPLEEPLEELPRILEELHSSKEFSDVAKSLAETLARTAAPAIVNPEPISMSSVFSVVSINRLDPDLKASQIIERLGPTLAKSLRTSDDPIGSSEVLRTLSPNITYSDEDIVFISSRVAIVFDETASEVIDVFELANVQFLELSFIDHRLDRVLQSLYDDPTQKAGWFGLRLSNPYERQARRLHTISLDSTILVDRVEQIFKFATDSYLVQIHELCVQKMFLHPLSRAVDRKLGTIRSIVNDQRDLASSIRMEFLEWIIIILIFIGTVPVLFQYFR